MMLKEEAVRLHRELWNWIAEETLRTGKVASKSKYFEAHPNAKEALSDCYCCEYISENANCSKQCLVEWPNISGSCSWCDEYSGGTRETVACVKKGSPYLQYLDLLYRNPCTREDAEAAARIAYEIANLPVNPAA